MSMNKLTERLLAEGYTKENHPDYVRWYGNMEEFEYTPEYLETTVWEAPCRIMRKGEFTHGYLSYADVDWRAENDNYNFHCPYNKKECEHFHPLLRDITIGAKCSWHMTDKPYDYDNSVEKIEDERKRIIGKNLEKKFGHPGMIHCACCRINEETLEPYFKYEPRRCINFMNNGCDNKTCWCTGKERDLTLANIYYDVRITTEYSKGFIVEPVIQITKGEKLFDSRKAITDLELYLKKYPDAPLQKEKGKSKHSRRLFFAKYHGEKYDLEILSVRIEKRESRDLMQDLQDIKDGIEVVHASDLTKAVKKDKKERREKYKGKKIIRRKKKNIENWKTILKNDEAAKACAERNSVSIDFLRTEAERQLRKRNILIEKEPKQLSMF